MPDEFPLRFLRHPSRAEAPAHLQHMPNLRSILPIPGAPIRRSFTGFWCRALPARPRQDIGSRQLGAPYEEQVGQERGNPQHEPITLSEWLLPD